MKKTIKVLAFVICFTLLTIPVIAAVNQSTRLFGVDRYQTALEISKQYNSGFVNSVVLVPGSNYANALPASVLAYKQGAPLLLVDSTASKTKEAFEYIISHLTKIGTIYLVGDSNLIGSDFESKLNQLGYKNILHISGTDKYETDYLIAKELNISHGSPLVISSGENFPDALAISSFAATYGWPILLTCKDEILPKIREYIQEKQPSKIYITGGTGVISASLEKELKTLVPGTKIQRFGGADRYDTAIQIANEFAPGPVNIYVSSGLNFPDALAGSVLAAKNGGPIILVNPLSKGLHPGVKEYLQRIKELKANSNLTFFGGTAVIPTGLEELVAQESGFITDNQKILEDEVITLVNKERTSRGLEALAKNDVLSKLARLKSQDMVDKDYFDHQSPTYGSPFDMMKSFGITFKNAGENIASGQSTSKMVMVDWMNSPGHRENILKEEYQEIGVGVVKDSNGQLYWTQMFIRK